MSVAEIKQTKLNLIAWIAQLSDTNMLSFLEGLKNSAEGDWWDGLSEAQKAYINEGLKDDDAGSTVSSTEFWNRLKNG